MHDLFKQSGPAKPLLTETKASQEELAREPYSEWADLHCWEQAPCSLACFGSSNPKLPYIPVELVPPPSTSCNQPP